MTESRNEFFKKSTRSVKVETVGKAVQKKTILVNRETTNYFYNQKSSYILCYTYSHFL